MKLLLRLSSWAVPGLLLLAAIAVACVFTSSNLSWMRGWLGTLWFCAVAGGVLGGLFGGCFLAIAKKNPLWLAAAVVSLCMIYFAFGLMYALSMANMH